MMKRKGLFGSPGTTAFAEMVQGVGEPRAMTTQPVDVMQAPPVEKKPGFFGNGGVGWQIMGSIGDALREANGLEASYGPSMMLQRQQQLAAQRQQQEREYEWQDWQRKQEWERANPKPVNNDTINDFNWFKSLSAEDRALYGQMKPQYITADNGDGTKTILPVTPGMFGGQQPSMTPTAPVGKLRPIGGGSGGNVGGGFR